MALEEAVIFNVLITTRALQTASLQASSEKLAKLEDLIRMTVGSMDFLREWSGIASNKLLQKVLGEVCVSLHHLCSKSDSLRAID